MNQMLTALGRSSIITAINTGAISTDYVQISNVNCIPNGTFESLVTTGAFPSNDSDIRTIMHNAYHLYGNFSAYGEMPGACYQINGKTLQSRTIYTWAANSLATGQQQYDMFIDNILSNGSMSFTFTGYVFGKVQQPTFV